jgi:beta-lactamase class D
MNKDARMNRRFRIPMIVIVALICSLSVLSHWVQPALTTPSPSQMPIAEFKSQPDFQRHFKALEVEGSIVIANLKGDRIYQHNRQRNQTAFLPASTFKILNSLIALETGVISDEIAVLTWDGIQRQIPEWNHDLNLKEAFKRSAVWFYQVLARRVGHTQMQTWVTKAAYGNQAIGDKESIDQFWLEGELRITPQAQVEFLQRLYKEELPFSKRSISIVKDIMISEKTPEYTLRGKTGWVGFGSQTRPQIGWYVGYVERDKDVYFFAININIRNDKKDAAARVEVTRRCLKDLGLL